MDLEKLYIFTEISKLKNLTKTANNLKLNKSTISRQLSLLEEELGKPLFHRKGREMHLNTYGEFFLEKAKIILSEIDIALQVFKGDEIEEKGSLSISSTHALISTWLTRNLKSFINLYPDFSIKMTAENTPIDQLWKDADLALRPYIVDHSELEQEFIMRWTLCLYASEEYLEQYGTPKTLEDLDHHKIIIFAESTNLYSESYTHWPLFIGTKFGHKRKPIFILNSLQGMYNLVKDGLGIGAFAKGSPLFIEKPLVPILEEKIQKEIEVFCIYPKEYKNLQKLNKFITYLKKVANNEIGNIK